MPGSTAGRGQALAVNRRRHAVDILGSIEVGKLADFVIIPVSAALLSEFPLAEFDGAFSRPGQSISC